MFPTLSIIEVENKKGRFQNYSPAMSKGLNDSEITREKLLMRNTDGHT